MADDPNLGTLEERTKSSFRDLAISIYDGLGKNQPTYDPERRRFLRTAALASAATATFLATGCQTTGSNGSEPQPNPAWKSFLLGEDHIYGPRTYTNPLTGIPNDYEQHIIHSLQGTPLGAHDFVSPVGIPIVPSRKGVASLYYGGLFGARSINVYHQASETHWYRTVLAHLDAYSGSLTRNSTWEENKQTNQVGMLNIMGYSGSHGTPGAHLHQALQEHHPTEYFANGKVKTWGPWERPGLDPQKSGLGNGGRQIYYDGTTELENEPLSFESKSAIEMRILDYELDSKSADELGISTQLHQDLRQRISESEAGPLTDFLRHEVLSKHADKDGRENYRHLPGSFMYGLTNRVIRPENKDFFSMLPFPSPHVAGIYQAANPKIQL